MNDFPPAHVFCQDSELGYERSRTRFISGERLILDETYRLAHLPLVAPDHPRVIRMRDGSSYVMGRHERVFSLVLPISGDLLHRSPAYRALNEALRVAPFAPKIAWDLLDRRKDKLHATICGSLSSGEPPVIDRMQRQELAGVGPIHVELRGLFSGSVNRGRLYLRAYPESRKGENVFRHIQRALSCRETDLYVVGVYNLTDDLDAEETAALASLIERWWDRTILQVTVDHLWLMGACDDLVLDSIVAETVSLV
ncbi:hypothetical protein [Microvirga terrestris]|uniref:Uncharacterized protein n=1 Tax=Microvirga terrestris TaxID=2791024 RepID=A0ABS0HPR6_9HYPH|nr:hypothetical protein [Microvirga terrestris]MBF9195472.1 hypothetical protein [Microvirga terrestris]